MFQGQTQRIQCGPIKSFAINVLYAYYGRKSKNTCGYTDATCSKTIDVTSEMKKARNGRNECEVGVTFFNSHSLEIDPFVALSYAKKKTKIKMWIDSQTETENRLFRY